MILLWGILPILALVILIIFFINRTAGSKLWMKQWLFIGYGALLCISTVLYFFLPDPVNMEGKKASYEQFPDLYSKVYEGKAAEIDQKYIGDKWNFDYQAKKLAIEAPGNDVNGISIFVDKSNELEDSIEIIDYRTPVLINDQVDISEYIPDVTVNLLTDTLQIIQPEPANLKYSGYKSEFPFTQFMKGKEWGWMDETNFYDEEVLVIRVPADVDVEFDEFMGIEMLED